jgi:type IV pilus assembly protein PilF
MTGVWVAAGLMALGLLAGCAAPFAGGSSLAESSASAQETPERKRARIRLELAVGYFEEGRTAIALDEVRQALATDPHFAAAHNLRGLILMRLHEVGPAEASFRRALALAPHDPDNHHNLGWLLCQQSRHAEAADAFQRALAQPSYTGPAKTWMAQGLCQARAGRLAEAERSLVRAYELDAGNPVTGYNLARLLFDRREDARARFYIRRLNNTELANAESLWLGVKVEKRLGDEVVASQLGDQLRRRFPQSRESAAYERGAFHE